MERRKRTDPFFDFQRHRGRPALRRVPFQHASDFSESAVELGSEFWKPRYPQLAVKFLRRALPQVFKRAAQLQKLMDQASPRVAGFPYFVAVYLRTVEQAAEARE